MPKFYGPKFSIPFTIGIYLKCQWVGFIRNYLWCLLRFFAFSRRHFTLEKSARTHSLWKFEYLRMLNAINHTNRSDSWVNCQTPNYITNWIHLANNFSEINWTWGAWISIKLTDFTLYPESETPRFNQNTMKSRERIFISWLFFLSPPKIFHDVDFGLSNGFGHLLFLTKYLYEIAQSHMLKYKNTKSTTKKLFLLAFYSVLRLDWNKRNGRNYF